MKDYFSDNSPGYSQFRPHYPQEMIQQIVSLVPNKYAALDVAMGNGQLVAKLADFFQHVYATGIREIQMK